MNHRKSNKPVLIDTADELSTKFKFNGQEVVKSCGVTFQNKHYIFGGKTNRRQILRIDDCDLISIGSTPFDHYLGACDSTDKMIILCFDFDDPKRCRQASSPTGSWTQMEFSTYDHAWTSIATAQGDNLSLIRHRFFFNFRCKFLFIFGV